MKRHSPIDMAKLLGGMSLEEKLGQLTMIRADEAEVRNGRAGSILDLQEPARIHKLQEIALGETRLGIPLLFALDVLHGYDTIFPIPLAEAAAMDPALWEASAHGGGLRDGGGRDSADVRADAGRVARPALGADGGKSGRGPMAWVALCGGQGPGISGSRPFRTYRDCRDRQAFCRLWRGRCRPRIRFRGCFQPHDA